MKHIIEYVLGILGFFIIGTFCVLGSIHCGVHREWFLMISAASEALLSYILMIWLFCSADYIVYLIRKEDFE